MKTRQEIKALAKAAMSRQYGVSIALFIVVMVISLVLSLTLGAIPFLGIVVNILVLVLTINMYGQYIKIYKDEKGDVGEMFSAFGVNFGRKLGGSLWHLLLLVLWTLLLIIPGIIKTFAYFFNDFILADCPNVQATDAVTVSMRITEGRKWDIFVFTLTFLGWFFLSALTFGVLWFFYVAPYYHIAVAGLYVEMRDEALREGRITPQDLGWSTEMYSDGYADGQQQPNGNDGGDYY
jgi:uncharacterized membrane protein